jgi:putative NADH-flavin reductase
MKLILFGASGATGHELVKQALEKGYQVTGFVRDPVKMKISHSKLELIVGDVANDHLVGDAINGKDAVFSTLGAASPFKYDQSVVIGISNIVNAMMKSGVNRLIYMSAINVKESRKQAGLLIRVLAPLLLRLETAGHEAREKIIRASPLQWTLVRSAGLTNGMRTGIYRSGTDISANGIVATISRADVADFMMSQLNNDQYIRKMPLVMY